MSGLQADGVLAELAGSAGQWRTRALTPELSQAARDAVLDWFATTLPGCVLPPATILATALSSEAGPGGAVC